jgi:hypothetical protein
MLTLEQMVREAGVDLRLETTVTGARCGDGNRLEEIEIFCGCEKERISADCFVDATGGAFVLRMAGAKVFPETNYHNPWVLEAAPGCDKRVFTGDLHVQITSAPEIDGSMPQVLSAAEIQEFMRRQYRVIRDYYDTIPAEQRKEIYPVHLPMMPQIRKIARIDGLAEIRTGEAGKRFEDSIGIAADWRKLAPAWETPYGALLSRQVRGALTAGRSINSSGDAWEVFRVIPAAAMTGEAAGVAAAMGSEQNIDPAAIPVAALQQELQKTGGIMHLSDSKPFNKLKR